MISEQLAKLFSLIAEIECWDMEDSTCIDGVNAAISQAGNSFYTIAAVFTAIFIVLAALPKYTFKWSILNDIILRRLMFFIGLALTTYMLLAAWTVAKLACTMRDDGDVALEVFSSKAATSFYLSIAIYPASFLLLAFLLNKFMRRRKLITIFRSNNKIFGLI